MHSYVRFQFNTSLMVEDHPAAKCSTTLVFFNNFSTIARHQCIDRNYRSKVPDAAQLGSSFCFEIEFTSSKK